MLAPTTPTAPLAESACAEPASAAPTWAASASCAACGEGLAGDYCHACGERAVRPEDESLAAFLREQFQEVTSADGKLWRTFRALFVPGKLTTEYLSGRRGLYVRPVRIFLVLNVVLFFAISGSDGSLLKGPLRSNYGAAVYGPTARALAVEKAARWGVPMSVFESAFDAQARAMAPSLIGVLIPGFAVLLAMLLWPARAPGVRHIVLATHIVAALVALAFLLMISLDFALAIIRRLVGNHPWTDSMDPILIPLMIISFATYIGVAVRRVYAVPRWAAAAAGLALGTVGFFFAIWCFRLATFAVTLWTVDPPA